MTIETANLSRLKSIKNSVIGNPSAKLQLAQDKDFISTLIVVLGYPQHVAVERDSRDDMRIEAAHILTSLSYGIDDVLASLLRCNALAGFLNALVKLHPDHEPDFNTLQSSFARALRALTVSIAEVVGPSLWGLGQDKSTIRDEAKTALDCMFHVDSLDIFLPLLAGTTAEASTWTAQLVAFAVRSSEHRKAVTSWLPPGEREKEHKVHRGWENLSKSNGGGWVAACLANFLQVRNAKLQEAALYALAALARDNSSLASVLARPPLERDASSILATVLSMTKSRSRGIQLAACLCATHILRASSPSGSIIDDNCARAIMSVIGQLLMSQSTDSNPDRTKACYILYYLVMDNSLLCQLAYERGCLDKLAVLIRSVTPLEKTTNDWEDEEPESLCSLREAALTTIAVLALFDNEIRHSITDEFQLLPIIHSSLSHRHVGIRYAACQCVRALSRAVSALRTNIMDTGIGMTVFSIFKKEDEDRRVTNAALASVCNIVNDFSPLSPIFLEQGLMPRLTQLLGSGDTTLGVSSLWAIKNLLCKASIETKREVMNHVGWHNLACMLEDSEPGIQEQALNILRNLAENEEGIEMVFREIGPEMLLNRLTAALLSHDEDVVLQAAFSLANLSNGSEVQQGYIFDHSETLRTLQYCLSSHRTNIRRPIVGCISQLSRTNPRRRNDIIEAGFVSTLKHMCDWGGGMSVSPSTGSSIGPGRSVAGLIEDDKDVIGQARSALGWLERSDGYIS